ncbi:hypothetical protein OEZ85_012848 [Tetradesmus obliquus]|uniref:Uncharacterized protein n=1 Tax=Tetradesmus obliquus TaxID=3088 RepID=A0ABY8U4J4_TETOB|nr:hypothetical protein OEZ85_012848 [Tetradesmus obliquus]
MWPKHTQTVLAFKTTSNGNPDLDDMGNPKVDHKNSCYKGQCIKVSEKDLVWEPLRLAVVQVMEDVFGVSAQDAAEKIRKKASQQAKTIEHAHAAADAAKTAVIAEILVARWFPDQALGGAGAATVGHEKTADTAAGGTAGAEQHRAPSQSGDGSAGSIDATGERQAPGSRAPSAAAEQRQPGWQASMDGSMQCSGGGMPSAPGAAGAGKGSPGGAAWKNLNKLLGAHHVPPELMQEIGLARKGVVGAMQAGDRPTVDQLRRDATKGLLAFLPTAASKVAAQHSKDHDGDKAVAKRLRRKRRAEAAGKKSADSTAGGAAGGSRQQRQKRQPPKRKKQDSEESEEEADSDSSSNSSRDEDEAAGNSDDMDYAAAAAAAAAAATNGRSRRAGAGRNQRLEEYER